ncbi:hypothetical protein [Pseudomonas reactans]|uniref:hypothetical protein n=1 Tax=Pseudomonas reactans TaxID=117680 RepID=UPI0015A49E8B|nr:hypothetical protein [Pseudomonas reactans]NWC89958.1 hypothetical protein [Pseudomonas reactans]
MVTHYSTITDQVACGRNNHNLVSSKALAPVTCKTCRSTEAYRAAQASPAKDIQRQDIGVQTQSSPAGPATPVGKVAFQEWLCKRRGHDQLPRGKYFNDKRAGLKAFQVGEYDIVAAYTPKGAIEVFCEQSGFPSLDYTVADVQLVGNKHLDSLLVFDQDEGKTEMLKTSLRQDVAALNAPAYMYGWE